MSFEAILFYLLVIDSVSCNLLVLFGSKWYTQHLRIFSRWFPPAEGWALYYLVLVLWIGTLLLRLNLI